MRCSEALNHNLLSLFQRFCARSVSQALPRSHLKTRALVKATGRNPQCNRRRSLNTPRRYNPSCRHRPAGGPHREEHREGQQAKNASADVTCCLLYSTDLAGSSVTTVTRLLARRPRNRLSSPGRAHCLTSAVSTGGKSTHRSCSTEVQVTGAIPPLPHIYLHGIDRDSKFTSSVDLFNYLENCKTRQTDRQTDTHCTCVLHAHVKLVTSSFALIKIRPIAVAARSKACVYGRSLDGIAGSNPAGGMDVCLL